LRKFNSIGTNSFDCIVKIIKNPFDISKIDSKLEESCLSPKHNGFVSKNLRMLLIMTDLAKPYINFSHSLNKVLRVLTITWIVGGAFSVDQTFILYNITNNSNDNENKLFIERINNHKGDNFRNFKDNIYSKTSSLSGRTTWKLNELFEKTFKYDDNNNPEPFKFTEQIKIPKDSKKISFLILTKVDSVIFDIIIIFIFKFE